MDAGGAPSFQDKVSNTVTITGVKEAQDTITKDEYWNFSNQKAGGYSDNYYKIVKVEKDRWNKQLDGAVFTLYNYSLEDKKFVSTGYTYITSSTSETAKGYFTVNYETTDGSGYNFAYDTAYCLIETEAPTGYKLSSTPYYFYFSNPNSSDSSGTEDDSTVVKNMPDNFTDANGEYNPVDITTGSKTAYVENTPALTVKKVWQSADKKPMTEVDQNLVVKATLQQYAGDEPTGMTWPITLDSGNYWTYTDENLPTTDETGKVTYTYQVVENSVTIKGEEGTNLIDDYTVEYTDNGISLGTITITNKLNTKYELPETGGTGRTILYMFGGMLALGAGFLLIYKKHKII
jgi:LPXTG-motif cell wall-anchored protein